MVLKDKNDRSNKSTTNIYQAFGTKIIFDSTFLY